jgi:hypothetical protein
VSAIILGAETFEILVVEVVVEGAEEEEEEDEERSISMPAELASACDGSAWSSFNTNARVIK